MKRLCACAAVLLAACLVLAAKGVRTSPSNAKSLSLVGRPAPAFTLQDLNERSFNLADTSGHVVVLSFWASWCRPCRAELPTLVRLQKELGTERVDVILVVTDSPVKARHFLEKNHLEARCLLDAHGTLAKTYGVRSIPRAFVIDGEGMIRRVLFGGSSEQTLRKAIQAAREQ